MAVWYLDNDDEITDAVARLRSTDDERVIFVVPPGSRIATGRINFKLLAREAEARDLTMAVASPDEQVRAMAASADVVASPTPDEAEAALERGDEPATSVPSAPVRGSASTVAASEAAAQPSSWLTWRSQRMRIATLLVLVAVIVGWALANQLLPTAEVTLTPRIAALGPLELTVTAAADVAEADVVAGVVPATVQAVPLTAEIEWESSGVQVTETKATGAVIFSSPRQDSEQEIGKGTRVETPAGTAFRTTETVFLQPSQDGAPAEVSAPIEAIEGGEAGNRPAGRITVAPTLGDQGINVTNPEATAGGRTESAPLVESADYEDAVENLENLLRGRLKAYVEDPANAPAGLTVFPETRSLGALLLEPLRDSIVGTTNATFTLTGRATGEVLAVDESQVDTVSRARLDAALPAGMRLLDGSVEIGHEDGSANGSTVVFASAAGALMTPIIDIEALATELAGLPVSEAEAILEPLGTATVNVWPGFLGDLPNDRERITLDVLEASATE